MMNYVVISPYFPYNFQNFVKTLAEEGIRVLGVGSEPYEQLGPLLHEYLTEYYKVDTLEDTEAVKRAVAFFFHKYGPIDRVESHNEHWLELDAALRTQFNIPGSKTEDTKDFKYKSKMKQIFKKAKVPVVDGQVVKNDKDVDAAVKKFGYPVVAKPDNGVGSSATYRIENKKDLDKFKKEWNKEVEYFMEPYVTDGVLCTFDGLLDRDGNIVFCSGMQHREPTLEQLEADNDLAVMVKDKLDPELEKYGRAAVKAFGMKERFFHVEFFKTKKGYVALEYNNRLPGGYTIDLYNHVNGIDLYKIYSQIVAGKKVEKVENSGEFGLMLGRRFHKSYVNDEGKLLEEYPSEIKMVTDVPQVLSSILCDRMFIAATDSEKEAKALTDEILKTN